MQVLGIARPTNEVDMATLRKRYGLPIGNARTTSKVKAAPRPGAARQAAVARKAKLATAKAEAETTKARIRLHNAIADARIRLLLKETSAENAKQRAAILRAARADATAQQATIND